MKAVGPRLIAVMPAPINDDYANGYGNSKWGGEVLLREAHDLAGLPVGASKRRSTRQPRTRRSGMFLPLMPAGTDSDPDIVVEHYRRLHTQTPHPLRHRSGSSGVFGVK